MPTPSSPFCAPCPLLQFLGLQRAPGLQATGPRGWLEISCSGTLFFTLPISTELYKLFLGRKRRGGIISPTQASAPPGSPCPLGGLPLFQLLTCVSQQHPLTAILCGLPEQTEPSSGWKVVTLTLAPWRWGRGEPAGSALGYRIGGTVSCQCDSSAPPLQVLHGAALLSPRKLVNSDRTERLSVNCFPPTAVSWPLPLGQLGLPE